MTYDPTIWVDDDGTGTTGTVMRSELMNKLESGVQDAHGRLDEIEAEPPSTSGPSAPSGGLLFTDDFSAAIATPPWLDPTGWDVSSGHLKQGTGDGVLTYQNDQLPFWNMEQIVFMTGATVSTGGVGIGLHLWANDDQIFVHVEPNNGNLSLYQVVNGTLAWINTNAGPTLPANTRHWLNAWTDASGIAYGTLSTFDPAVNPADTRVIQASVANSSTRFHPYRLQHKRSLRWYSHPADWYVERWSVFA